MVDHIVDASGPRGRVEIRNGVGRRRRWSDEEKGRIVAESFAPGAVVSEVARRHEMSPASVCLAQDGAGRPVGAAGRWGGYVRAGHDDGAEGDCREVSAVDHDRDGWGGVSSRMRGGCGVAGGCAARGEGSVMIIPSGAVRVLMATRPVDFRKGMDGLAALARESLGSDPYSGVIYVFRAKRADRVDESHEGSRPDANYHDRIGYRQENVFRSLGSASEQVVFRKRFGVPGTAFFKAASVPDRYLEECATPTIGRVS